MRYSQLRAIAKSANTLLRKHCECRNVGGMSTAASRIIEKCGGVVMVAELVGVDVSRVYRWTYPRDRGGTGGVIPAKHQQRLMARAREHGIDLMPADFFDLPPLAPAEHSPEAE